MNLIYKMTRFCYLVALILKIKAKKVGRILKMVVLSLLDLM
ncbi:hypothetical protein PPIS_a0164 [Pseudoalteromonas piscicida]|uniref:Uncharacterized protein n=1 Tax=Pseudoalteromonas piscicida TaxID=43662 RepID=A0ABM6N9I8_PSEO7|nr:hypothetical protein PPIS_a0164 [Pseudoalteromonas piscicida]